MKFKNLLSTLLITVASQAAIAIAAAPNIITIVTDDQGYWTIGAYGNKESITPNMDSLARDGALFENAFATTPVCSPTRASMLTGLYSTEHRVTDYLNDLEQDRGYGLPVDDITWPEMLQQNGYRTALVGKWHLGMQPQFHPKNAGFDHYYGFLGGGNKPMNPRNIEINGVIHKQLKGSLPDILTDEAMRWIDEPSTEPFALVLTYRAPHLPYGPVPEEDSAPFKNLDPTIPDAPGIDKEQVKNWTRDYYASIHSVDRNLGRLFDHLEQRGLTSNTLIMFMSDHGYNVGQHTIHKKGNANWIAGGVFGPKRPNMYENSMRIPLLMRWPAAIKPGTRIHECITNMDLFATIATATGTTAPADQVAKKHSRNLMPLLKGQRVAAWDNTVFGDYDIHHGALEYMRMIRTPEYKLIRHYISDGLDEFYDLRKDPGELNNLFKDPEYREQFITLQARLAQWQRSINDPVVPQIEELDQFNENVWGDRKE